MRTDITGGHEFPRMSRYPCTVFPGRSKARKHPDQTLTRQNHNEMCASDLWSGRWQWRETATLVTLEYQTPTCRGIALRHRTLMWLCWVRLQVQQGCCHSRKASASSFHEMTQYLCKATGMISEQQQFQLYFLVAKKCTSSDHASQPEQLQR